jgi:hypothetical protein
MTSEDGISASSRSTRSIRLLPERQAGAVTFHVFRSRSYRYYPYTPPNKSCQAANTQETGNANKDDVVASPFEHTGVPMIPSPALFLGEKAPLIPCILLLHEYPYICLSRGHFDVVCPYHRDEVWASAVHDGHIWKHPVVIVRFQRINQKLEVRMVFHSAHNMIGQPHSDGRPWHPSRERQ